MQTIAAADDNDNDRDYDEKYDDNGYSDCSDISSFNRWVQTVHDDLV